MLWHQTCHMTVFDLASPARDEHRMTGRVGPAVQRLWRWGAARSHAAELDGLIADGDRLSAPELREVRARQLVKLRRRAAVAAQIEACVEAASTDIRGARRRTSVWLVDLRDAEVRAAAADLLEHSQALRSSD
jgi:hypothetical protein